MDGGGLPSIPRGEPGRLSSSGCDGPIVKGKRSCGPGGGGPEGPGALPRSRSRSRCISGGAPSSVPLQNADIRGEAVVWDLCEEAVNSMSSVGAPERGRRGSISRPPWGLRVGFGAGPLTAPDGSPDMGGPCGTLPGPVWDVG